MTTDEKAFAEGVTKSFAAMPSSALEQRYEALLAKLRKKWLADVDALLNAAGVPKWVEVEGTTGNTAPHRLQWYICRRKDASELLAAIDAHIEAYTCELAATVSAAKLMAGDELGPCVGILFGTIDRLKARRHELAANAEVCGGTGDALPKRD